MFLVNRVLSDSSVNSSLFRTCNYPYKIIIFIVTTILSIKGSQGEFCMFQFQFPIEEIHYSSVFANQIQSYRQHATLICGFDLTMTLIDGPEQPLIFLS